MMLKRLFLWGLVLAIFSFFTVTAESATVFAPPIPARIGGTIAANGGLTAADSGNTTTLSLEVMGSQDTTCGPGHLEVCTNQGDCEGAGGAWDGSQCVSSCGPDNLGACTTNIQCAYYGGWWNGSQCLQYTSYPCSPSNLDGCVTQEECASVGGYWYNSTCNAAPFCVAAELCTSEDTCESSGFFWYGGTCNATPPCSADHLEVCATQADCEAVGGTWDGSQCVSSCSPDNLGACTTNIQCAYYGGMWDTSSGTCRRAQSASCGSDYLAGCHNLMECANAGGVWSGICREARGSTGGYMPVPIPTVPHISLLDTTGDIEAAPVYLGPVVTGGGLIGLKINFSAYAGAVDLWVAIQLPDGNLVYLDSYHNLTFALAPFGVGVTTALSAQIVQEFGACPVSPLVPMPEGIWAVYWLITPTNGGNIDLIDFGNDPYELGYYVFDLQCHSYSSDPFTCITSPCPGENPGPPTCPHSPCPGENG